MDEETKKQMLQALAPAAAKACVPLMQVAITNHYDSKRLEQREKFEVQKAEHKVSAIRAAAGGETQPAPPEPSFGGPGSDMDEPAGDPLGEAIDVAEELDQRLSQAQETEECGFCREVLAELENEPPEVQRQGLRELRELKEVMYADPSKQQIDQVMGRMEIVPRMVV